MKLVTYGVTLNALELVALPPDVVIATFPVFAPLGTFTVTSVSEITEKLVAFTLPNVTAVVCVRLPPVMVTKVPTGPSVRVKLVICGMPLNFVELFSIPLGVVTVTYPVVVSAGTVARISPA